MATDFGSDFAGVGDFDSALSIVEGEQCLAEAIANRLQARKGTLLGNPDYGESLNDLLNESMDDADVENGRRRVEMGCMKDERVKDVSASSEFTASTGALDTEIALVATEGPFKFTLSASAAGYSVIFGTT